MQNQDLHAPAFEIESIVPTGYGDIWLAILTVRISDTVAGEAVDHVTRVSVRFNQTEDQPIRSLLETAYIQAQNTLVDAAAFLAANNVSDLLNGRRESWADLKATLQPSGPLS